jgi:hypothetical protein
MFGIYKDRLIKLILVLMVIYFGLVLFNKINNTNENQLIQKTIFLTILVTFTNFMYPTL